MGPARLTTYPPRIWTVDIRTRHGTTEAVCRTCGPLTPVRTASRTLRDHALHHLAAHARRDLTPPHLRSCQCGHHGCTWHRRHRGCTGPILLALTCEEAPHSWRLADLCLQCVNATAHTTPVPGPTGPASPTPEAAVRIGAQEDDEQQVWAPVCPGCGVGGDSSWCAECCVLEESFPLLRTDMGPIPAEAAPDRSPSSTKPGLSGHRPGSSA